VFVLAIVTLILGGIAVLVRLAVARGAVAAGRSAAGVRPALTITSIALGVLALLFLLLSTIAVVGTKEVGIVTAFNRPVGTLDNGFHLKAPWENVTEMDAAIQTDNHVQSSSSCINARIAHQIIACVDTTVRWRIRESAADTLFRDYRDFDNVRNSLVSRELATDINSTLSTYDPLAVDSGGNATAASLTSLAGDVSTQMHAQIGTQVEVLSVFIPVMHFDGSTQSRINALQSQIAQTRIAEQAVKTAAAQADANRALAASVSNNPNVLVSRCFDVLTEMVNKGQTVPAGFSCWPGGGTGVVIPAR
jgi:regulator of protease activity HflC (stomatin/prohibitin superfamily)